MSNYDDPEWRYSCLSEPIQVLLRRHPHTVFEIKEFSHAHAGCTDRQNHEPNYLFVCIFLYKGIHNCEFTCTRRVHRFKIHAPGTQNVHTGCRVHP